MSQSPITVTSSLESILGEIKDSIKDVNQKIDTLQKDVNEIRQKDLVDLKVGQATLTEKVDSIGKRLEKVETEQSILVKDISDLKGIKSLIIPLIVAVTTALVTVFIRSLPNP